MAGSSSATPSPVKKKRFDASQEKLARDTAIRIAQLIATNRNFLAINEGRPTVGSLVVAWKKDKAQFMPWDDSTRRNIIYKMDRIARELGERHLSHTHCMFLEEWLASFCPRADAFNKWRYALVLLWRFGVSRRMVDICEPEKIEERSTSKKLESNRKLRQPLDVEGFKAIYAVGEPWLKLAMDISLVTLQARSEVCRMKHADFRDGFLFVIRDKTSGDSDMAFIKIALTAQLDEFRARSRALDNTLSPYIVHRAPSRQRREWIASKPHWTFVQPDFLTKSFEDARNAVERFANMPQGSRPSYHEIRGLGARLYRERGIAEDAIQALMTHANRRTTAIYLEGGQKALGDDDYNAVAAPLSLGDLLG